LVLRPSFVLSPWSLVRAWSFVQCLSGAVVVARVDHGR